MTFVCLYLFAYFCDGTILGSDNEGLSQLGLQPLVCLVGTLGFNIIKWPGHESDHPMNMIFTTHGNTLNSCS